MHIRTGMRSSWLVVAAILLSLLSLVSVGCGGSTAQLPGGNGSGGNGGGGNGGGGGVPATPADFAVKIEWGARSRVQGLSSALSAKITLAGADKDGKDIVWQKDRPASNPGVSVTETYPSPTKAMPGNYILTVKFYAQAGATGDEVGFAQASATVVQDGSLTVTISSYTGVQTVRVIPGQSVEVGQTKDLAFEARNKEGTVVAVTPGSAFFTVVTGTANLESVVTAGVSDRSSVRGKRPIEATVRVQIDAATSAPERVAVTSTTALAVNPTTAAIGSEFGLDLNAVVSNAPETDVTFQIEGGASATTGSLENVTATTVTYVAPKVTGSNVVQVNLIVFSNYDSTKRQTIPITINAPATVTVTPAAPEISLEETVALSAVVNDLSPRIPSGDARRGVTWRILPDGTNLGVGRITRDGVYTAPKREGTFTVEATSVYDTTKKIQVPIKVESKVEVSVTPNPAPLLQWEDRLDLTAAVARTPNQQVTWTIVSPSGFDSALVATGASTARFTAPKANGTYVVKATSVYDNRRSFSIAIEVKTNVVVAITPPSARMSVKARKTFTASVTGQPAGKDATVTWSLTGPNGEPNTGNVYGTIDTVSGVYTSPASVAKRQDGKYELDLKVVATSNYDPASKATAPVTVVGGSLGVDVN